MIEPLLAGYYFAKTGRIYYTQSKDTKGDVPPAYHIAKAVFQPYFGYTLQPGRVETFEETRTWQANNFGFVQLVDESREYCCDYPYTRRDGELLVGVFGGSVGAGYALYAELNGGLERALRRVPAWRDKAVRIVNLAQPGFKQPQQLFAYLYFLSIGQDFDLIINIDGFNEVVTTWRNWDAGVEPNYPADSLWGAWGRRLEQYNVPYGERGFLLSNYHRITAQGVRAEVEDCSLAICHFVLLAKAHYHEWRAEEGKSEALESLTKRSYFPTATFSPLAEDIDIHRYTAELWRKSSIAMARLAKANGTPYLHLLQPNQWFEPAGPYEPIDPEHIYGWVIEPVNRGYNALLAEAPRLREAGVNFIDLTRLLSGQPAREVYIDDCCHYTETGYGLIFEATGAAAADLLAQPEG